MAVDPSQMRVGDAQRSEALEMLSQHYANGLLNLTEFEERTGASAVAKVRNDIDKLFQDLPPLDHAAADPHPYAPAQLSEEKELDDLLERGKKMHLALSIIGGITMLCFMLGLFVFQWDYFWLCFPVGLVAGKVVQRMYRIDREDKQLVKELMRTQATERTARLRQAAERRKELGH